MFTLPFGTKSNIRTFWAIVFTLPVLIWLIYVLVFSKNYPLIIFPIIFAAIFFGVPFNIKRVCYKFSAKVWRRVGRYSKKYILALTYYILLPIIGLAGNKMILEKPAKDSLWSDWNETGDSFLISTWSGKNWIADYLRFSFRAKNYSVVFLLPFIILLKFASEPGEPPPPEALLIYTLF